MISYGWRNSYDIVFSISLGQKDVTSYFSQPQARIGDMFNALTCWAMTGQTKPAEPRIILNCSRFAARVAEMMLTRLEWQGVELWRVWQHNNDEGHRVTGVICDDIAGQRQVCTMESYYEAYNDLNEF